MKAPGILAATIFCVLSGCYFSDGAFVQVYNYDNHDYRVELRLAENDRVMDVLRLKPFPRFESMDYFDDVQKGRYYLSIFKDMGDRETDRTGFFSMHDEDRRCYLIDGDASIDPC